MYIGQVSVDGIVWVEQCFGQCQEQFIFVWYVWQQLVVIDIREQVDGDFWEGQFGVFVDYMMVGVGYQVDIVVYYDVVVLVQDWFGIGVDEVINVVFDVEEFGGIGVFVDVVVVGFMEGDYGFVQVVQVVVGVECFFVGILQYYYGDVVVVGLGV